MVMVMIHVVMIYVQCMSVSEDACTVGVIKKFTLYYGHCTDAHTFFDEKTMDKVRPVRPVVFDCTNPLIECVLIE